MPNAVVKSFAKRSGKSVADIESYWDQAKKQAQEKFGEKSDKFWAYVNAITKRRAGLTTASDIYAEMREEIARLNNGESDAT